MAKDLTQGKPWKQILIFSLPIMAGLFLQQLYNTVDSAIVGNLISQDALSAVGTCTPLTMLFTALAMGFSNGAAVVVSQYFGAKEQLEMRRSAITALVFLVGLGLVMTVTAILTARPLLQYVLGAPEENGVLDMAVAYFKWYAVGLLFQFGYNIFSSLLRAVGDSNATMYFLLISSVVNIALDLLFVAVFHWGVAGAAVATSISQLASCAAGYIYMVKKYDYFRFSASEIKLHTDKLSVILRIGIPAAIQQCIVSFGNILVQRLINSYGTDFMAAFSSAQRIEFYTVIGIMAFNQSISVFAGQNCGAGNYERVKKGYGQTLLMAEILICTLCALIRFAAYPVVGVFGLEGTAYSYACEYLRGIVLFIPLFVVQMTTIGLLQGTGDSTFAMICTLTALTLRVIASYLLAWFTPASYRALWYAMGVAWSLTIIVSLGRYFSGTWRKKTIVLH